MTTPFSLILRDLHKLPASATPLPNTWQSNVSSSVSAGKPSKFTWTFGDNPYYPDAAYLSIAGVAGEYTGGMWSLDLLTPPFPLTGGAATSAVLTTSFILDSGAPANLQALEFGVKATVPQTPKNLTLPSNYQLDNSESPTLTTLTVIPASGLDGWVPIPGGTFPRMTPYTQYTVSQSFSWGSGKMNIPQFTVNGQTFTVPSSLATIAGQNLGWNPAPMLTICVQPNVNQNGGAYDITLTQCDLELIG